MMRAKPDAKLIVAMAGGGADAYPMMQAIIDALPVIQTHQPCVLVLITGPFMPYDFRADLQKRARGLPAHILTLMNDTPSFLEAADLVIAMAGYNTTMEILHSGKPAILIPRTGPSAEQSMRARLFAARGWVETLELDTLNGDHLAQMVINNLRRELHPTPQDKPNLQGVVVTVEQLLSLLPPASSKTETVVPIPADVTNQSPREVTHLTGATFGRAASLLVGALCRKWSERIRAMRQVRLVAMFNLLLCVLFGVGEGHDP
jgi:predicted glycosyltransferase